MTALQGTYTVSMDSNGRLAVPARIRGVFPKGQQDTVFLTRGMESCIRGYYEERWNEFMGKIESLDVDYESKDALRHKFIAPSFEAGFDKQGRITVPARLLDYGQLRGCSEVYVMGCDGYLEIWNPSIYDAKDKEYEDISRNLMKKVNL